MVRLVVICVVWFVLWGWGGRAGIHGRVSWAISILPCVDWGLEHSIVRLAVQWVGLRLLNYSDNSRRIRWHNFWMVVLTRYSNLTVVLVTVHLKCAWWLFWFEDVEAALLVADHFFVDGFCAVFLIAFGWALELWSTISLKSLLFILDYVIKSIRQFHWLF